MVLLQGFKKIWCLISHRSDVHQTTPQRTSGEPYKFFEGPKSVFSIILLLSAIKTGQSLLEAEC